MDFTGVMFHGWAPSGVFYQLTDTLLAKVLRPEIIRIVSTVQCPSAKDQAGDPGSLPHFNAVQVLMVPVCGQDLYFLRVNPALRLMDSDINMTDGSRAPHATWVKKEKW